MSYSQPGTGSASLSNLLQPYVEALTGASGITEDDARICILYALVTHIDSLLYGLKFIPPLAFTLAHSESLIPEYHKRLRVTVSLSERQELSKISSCSLLIADNSFFCLLGGNTFSIGLAGR